MMTIRMPGHIKHDQKRTEREVLFVPCHEAFHDEISDDPTISEQVEQAAAGVEWSGNYFNHRVVTSNPRRSVIPASLYLDGAPFCKTDGFLAFTVINLISGMRHMSIILRKSNMCRCGCKGWCSIYPCMLFLNACFLSMASGKFFDTRPDGLDWMNGIDDWRASVAGALMCCDVAIVHIKGDWMEFTVTMGFPTWSSLTDPCLLCNAELVSLHNYSAFTLQRCPHAPKTMATFSAACDRCEVWVSVTSIDMHQRILDLLFYNKSKSSAKATGRILREDIVELGLRKDDRMEPHQDMPNHAAFDSYTVFNPPKQVVFWRKSAEGPCRHRNPIFNEETGVTQAIIGIDTLHTCYLGPWQRWCMWSCWLLLRKNPWSLPGNVENRHELGVLRLRQEIYEYYRSLPQAVQKHITEINDLTPKMLGTFSRQRLKTKAAESKHLVPGLIQILGKYRDSLGFQCQCLMQAGECLVAFD